MYVNGFLLSLRVEWVESKVTSRTIKYAVNIIRIYTRQQHGIML